MEAPDKGRRCVDHFMSELELLMNRFLQEYPITTIEIVGTLECMQHKLMADVREVRNDHDL